MKKFSIVLVIVGIAFGLVSSAFAEGSASTTSYNRLILSAGDCPGEGTFFVSSYGEDVYGIQAKLKFVDPNGRLRDDFRISTKDGNPDFGGQAIHFTPGFFQLPPIFPLYAENRQIFGAVFMDGGGQRLLAADFVVRYEMPQDLVFGRYTVSLDEEWTVLAGRDEPLPYTGSSVSFVIPGWKVPGDANGDCRVDVMDIIFVRNRLGQYVLSGDNWQADVNQDCKIDILDMIFVRQHLMTKCQSLADLQAQIDQLLAQLREMQLQLQSQPDNADLQLKIVATQGQISALQAQLAALQGKG